MGIVIQKTAGDPNWGNAAWLLWGEKMRFLYMPKRYSSHIAQGRLGVQILLHSWALTDEAALPLLSRNLPFSSLLNLGSKNKVLFHSCIDKETWRTKNVLRHFPLATSKGYWPTMDFRTFTVFIFFKIILEFNAMHTCMGMNPTKLNRTFTQKTLNCNFN